MRSILVLSLIASAFFVPAASADCVDAYVCYGSVSDGDCQGTNVDFNERNDVSVTAYAPDGSYVAASADTACYGGHSTWQSGEQSWYWEYNATSIDGQAGYYGSPAGSYYGTFSWYDVTQNYTYVYQGNTYEWSAYGCDTAIALYLGSTSSYSSQGCPAGAPPSVRPLL